MSKERKMISMRSMSLDIVKQRSKKMIYNTTSKLLGTSRTSHIKGHFNLLAMIQWQKPKIQSMDGYRLTVEHADSTKANKRKPSTEDRCFKCNRHCHWARNCKKSRPFSKSWSSFS